MRLVPATQGFRSSIATLMTLVICVVSLVVLVHRSAIEAPADFGSAHWLAAAPANTAAPCARAAFPGEANTCPFSGSGFVAILATDNAYAPAAPTTATRWRLSDSSLPLQVAGRGLYRPPRAAV